MLSKLKLLTPQFSIWWMSSWIMKLWQFRVFQTKTFDFYHHKSQSDGCFMNYDFVTISYLPNSSFLLLASQISIWWRLLWIMILWQFCVFPNSNFWHFNSQSDWCFMNYDNVTISCFPDSSFLLLTSQIWIWWRLLWIMILWQFCVFQTQTFHLWNLYLMDVVINYDIVTISGRDEMRQHMSDSCWCQVKQQVMSIKQQVKSIKQQVMSIKLTRPISRM